MPTKRTDHVDRIARHMALAGGRVKKKDLAVKLGVTSATLTNYEKVNKEAIQEKRKGYDLLADEFVEQHKAKLVKSSIRALKDDLELDAGELTDPQFRRLRQSAAKTSLDFVTKAQENKVEDHSKHVHINFADQTNEEIADFISKMLKGAPVE